MITTDFSSRYNIPDEYESSTDNHNTITKQIEAEEECKIVLIGDTNVGKTKITRQIGGDGYLDFYMKTLGMDFENKIINTFNTNIECKIFDTSGDIRFEYLISKHIKTANAIVFVYDITNIMTFHNIQTKWLPLFMDIITSECLLVLVGNQSDRTQHRAIQFNKAKQWANKMGMLFMETSAKNNINIDKLLIQTVQQSIAKQDLSVIPSENLLYLNMDSHIAAMHNVITGVIDAAFLRLVNEYTMNNILCLDVQIMHDMVNDNVCITQICDIIKYFASINVRELNMENFAVKQIYDVIKQVLCPHLRRCVITKCPFGGFKPDYILHAIALKFVEEFKCDIDDGLLRKWIVNDANEWSMFVKAIQDNYKLKSIEFCIGNISNDCVDKLCTLFCVIQKHALNLNSLILTFDKKIYVKDVKMLHSFIIECILSKRNQLEILSLTACDEQLLNTVFCNTLLLQCNSHRFPKLKQLIFNIPSTQLNNNNMLHICNIIQHTNQFIQLEINALFNTVYSKNDTTMQTIIKCVTENENMDCIVLKQFNKLCLYNNLQIFCELITNSNNIKCIELGFECLSMMKLLTLIEAFTEFIQTLYEYYKSFKQCLFDDIVSVLDVKTKSIIFEYCQLEKYHVIIHSLQEINQNIYSFEIDHIMKMFEIEKYNYIDTKLKTIKEMIAINGNINMCIYHGVSAQKYDVFSTNYKNVNKYNKTKWDNLVCIDYEILVFGFISKCCEILKTTIPISVCRMIRDYYPCFDLLSIRTGTDDRYEIDKWLHTSSILDTSNIYEFNNEFMFKSIYNNTWYYSCFNSQKILDNVCSWYGYHGTHFEQLTKKMIEQFNDINNENIMNYIDLVSNCQFQTNSTNLCCTAINGDIYTVYGWKSYRYKMNEKITDINMGSTHAIFLTVNGNVYGYGDVDSLGMTTSTTQILIPQKMDGLYNIKSIHVGARYNFCIDIEQNIYCFGWNNDNILGLNNVNVNDKSDDNKRVVPTLHKYFSQKRLVDIKTGHFGCVFIDNNGQCYITGTYNNLIQTACNDTQITDEIHILHFQKLWNGKYANVCIVNGVVIDDTNRSYRDYIYFIDSDNYLTMISKDFVIRNPINGIDINRKIYSMHVHNKQLFLICSK